MNAHKTIEGCDALLIGCGRKKRREPSPARDLYTSQYFAAKRAFAEASGVPWAILSAQHGVLLPEVITAPYERSADDFDRWERRWWAAGAVMEIFFWQWRCKRIAIIAGEAYANPLTDALRGFGVQVINPCEGLGIGLQIAWLEKAVQ